MFDNLKVSRLRRLMWLFFLAMALPTALLVYKSYDQLKWEAFYQHRQLAEELAGRIDQKFNQFVLREENRSFGDYRFAVVEGSDVRNLERSVLSEYPVSSGVSGLVGYFQVDAAGRLSTPLLPSTPALSERYGLSQSEVDERFTAQNRVEAILTSNQLVQQQIALAPPVSELATVTDFHDNDQTDVLESPPASIVKRAESQRAQLALSEQNQSAFDRLSQNQGMLDKKKKLQARSSDNVLGRLEELELRSPYKEQVGKREKSKQKSKVFNKFDRTGKGGRLRKAENKQRTYENAFSGKSLDDSSSDLSGKPSSALSGRPVVAEADPKEVVPQKYSTGVGIKIFENDIDPFEVSLLESGHFVLYRKIWRNDQRYIQGLLLQQKAFIDGVVNESFGNSLLAQMSTLTLVYQDKALTSFSNANRSYSSRENSQLEGTLLYRTRLSAPFNQLENVFTIRHLPAGPGAQVVLWAAFIMMVVLSMGIFLLYRMSLGNLSLVSQQQDFVSAVSHELKTPLTSIRMYGEILQQGWANEDKKKGYYRYIFDESERLTRLINNVLELARMTRNETRVDLKPVTVAELVDIIHSKIDSQIERSGFTLNVQIDDVAASAKVSIDSDIFSQIVINLVDNALKFSAKTATKIIDITAARQSHHKLCFTVRDYGPGIAKDQLKKIFELFYRSENELTRETAGTGIGLALVSQYTQLMGGKIDVVNREPGAEFRLYFSVQQKC